MYVKTNYGLFVLFCFITDLWLARLTFIASICLNPQGMLKFSWGYASGMARGNCGCLHTFALWQCFSTFVDYQLVVV